jgi:hypothetical protein
MKNEQRRGWGSGKFWLAPALVLGLGLLLATSPAQAKDEFEDGFKDELGRIAAHEAVHAGKHVVAAVVYGESHRRDRHRDRRDRDDWDRDDWDRDDWDREDWDRDDRRRDYHRHGAFHPPGHYKKHKRFKKHKHFRHRHHRHARHRHHHRDGCGYGSPRMVRYEVHEHHHHH